MGLHGVMATWLFIEIRFNIWIENNRRSVVKYLSFWPGHVIATASSKGNASYFPNTSNTELGKSLYVESIYSYTVIQVIRCLKPRIALGTKAPCCHV